LVALCNPALSGYSANAVLLRFECASKSYTPDALRVPEPGVIDCSKWSFPVALSKTGILVSGIPMLFFKHSFTNYFF
jgi:hypothetical protein